MEIFFTLLLVQSLNFFFISLSSLLLFVPLIFIVQLYENYFFVKFSSCLTGCSFSVSSRPPPPNKNNTLILLSTQIFPQIILFKKYL